MSQEPDEEIYGKALNKGAFVPVDFGSGMVAHVNVLIPQPGSFPNPLFLGFKQASLHKSLVIGD